MNIDHCKKCGKRIEQGEPCPNCPVTMEEIIEASHTRGREDMAKEMVNARFTKVVALWLRITPVPEVVQMQLDELRGFTKSNAPPRKNMFETMRELRQHIEVLVRNETEPDPGDEDEVNIAKAVH